MTRGSDTLRRHGISRHSKAIVLPLDVLHIPRGTINSRPRETTIDLIGNPREVSRHLAGNSSGWFSQSPARLGNRVSVAHSRPPILFPLVGKANQRETFDIENFMHGGFDSSVISRILSRGTETRYLTIFDCFEPRRCTMKYDYYFPINFPGALINTAS